ncbi:MAG TPA: DUF6504 family protein [Candidatus Sulfomarinibacteraceae bacterium]|nr:DUF6504 family protein [Candidatus Sulfomarinibacteraceae bacterium]
MESRFLSEPIEVEFDEPPLLEKKSGCPDRFVWGEETFHIEEKLSEWHDYRRRGRMSRNMRPARLSRAERTGSWGVGRDFYRVRTREERTRAERTFEIYYDRAPKDADRRKGAWVVYRELLEVGD